jgi:hypothetical protein
MSAQQWARVVSEQQNTTNQFELECAMCHAWLDNMEERLNRISPPKRKRKQTTKKEEK